MFDTFDTALSGLNADTTAINIIGNNLSNLNTVGYKSDEVQFSDLISQQIGGTTSNFAVGLGVGPAQDVKQFTQGSITQTNGPMDAAISGNGFFVVQDNTGQQLYTRAGNFQIAKDGSLLTASGDHVQGWNANGTNLNLSAPISNIQIPVNGVVPATATQNLSLTANLDATAVVGAANATFSSPVQVVDSQGALHTLTFSFTKTGANAWSYTVSIPAADLGTGGNTQVATGSLTFDSNGNLTSPASGKPVALKITGLADGATDMNVNWNLYNGTQGLLTQFAQTSGVSADTQDGMQAGQITNVSMGANGAIVASYSNGQQSTVAQLALASIQNPASMISVGDNNLKATIDTAAPAIGAANSGGRGKIAGQSLESSTVDIAKQFTNLIAFQQSYAANSKVISTADQMLQTLIAVKQ